MKYKKEYILNEIIRTAKQHNGAPLGFRQFEIETGIKKYDWFGKYWPNWGDALIDAGYEPNKLIEAYEDEFLLEKLIQLTRELGKFPSSAELRFKTFNDKSFPNMKTFDRAFGNKSGKITSLVEYCRAKKDKADVLKIYLPLLTSDNKKISSELKEDKIEYGFVYLIKSGKFHKIGRSNSAGRRKYEIEILLPEKADLVHEIKTDDPVGIEAYWHNRFKDKRKRGEWFQLSKEDVIAFKRRKFM